MNLAVIRRIKENKYYILYKRIKDKGDTIPLYVIYRTKEYGGDLFDEFKLLSCARRTFEKATKQAIEHERIIGF